MKEQNDKLIYSTGLALASICFYIDIHWELGIAGGVLYVVLIIPGLWAKSRRYFLDAALLGSLLTILGYYLSPPGGEFYKIVSNRALALFAIWVASSLGFIIWKRQSELKLSNLLLDSIRQAQSHYLSHKETRTLFPNLMQKILSLTQSEFAFISELLYHDDGSRYLKMHALSNIAWNEQTQNLYKDTEDIGMEWGNLDTLFGQAVKTGEPVIANDPSADPRSSGLPQGHPPLSAFLGLPIYQGKTIVGVAGMANRPGGYNTGLVKFLQPFLDTCATLITAHRSHEQEKNAVEALRRSEDRLRRVIHNMPILMEAFDSEGHIVAWNRECERATGYTADEVIIDPSIQKRFYPDPVFRAHMMKLWKNRSSHYRDWEWNITCKNGEVRTIAWSNFSGRFPIPGWSSWSVGVDITERRLQADLLKESREKYRSLFKQLSGVMAGTSGAISGENFFQTLVYHLSTSLNFKYSFIGKYTDSSKTRFRTLAFNMQGNSISNDEFTTEGTPCDVVLNGTSVFYTDRLQETFPEDKFLVTWDLQSYLGVPIYDESGGITGHLVVMDTEEKQYSPEIMAILSLFSIRAEAELKRIRIQEDLEHSREQLRKHTNRLEKIREEERTNIAREVHDQVGQMLTGLKFDLAWMEKRIPPKSDAVLEKIQSMDQLIDSIIRAVQKFCSDLRPDVLDVLGICEAIEWQAREFEKRTGIRTILKFSPEHIPLDSERATAVFRLFQETLTNVARHAEATEVRTQLSWIDSVLTLEVRDNGKGISKSQIQNSKSLGLLGMRERAFNFGGELTLEGFPGKGTRVSLQLPVKEPAYSD